jgi:hypothetical protein
MLILFAFADTSQQTNLFFSQPHFSQVRSNALSSWDNLEDFKFLETKHMSMHPMKTVGLDEMPFSHLQISTSVAAHTARHHDFNGLMPFRGTNTKILNQGTLLTYCFKIY